MKRYFFLLFVILSLAAISCEEKPVVDPDDPNENTDPSGKEDEKTGPQPGTYKFVASELKQRWNPSDQIYVHGALGTYAQTITLSASDISADGKTASVTLDEVTQLTVDPDGLYAAWPDAAVKHAYGVLGPKATFSKCDTLLMAAYLSGDTFNFIDVSSSLAFTVTADYNRFALAAGNRDGMNATKFEVEYTSANKEFGARQNDGYPFKYGEIVPGQKTNIWMPGEMTFTNGFSLFIGKDDNWTKVYTVSGDVTLAAGECMDLGDITSKMASYDGPAPRMPQVKGKPNKFSLSFEELSGLCLSAGEEFIWGVGDEGDLARISFEGKLLGSVHIGGDAEDVSLNSDTGDLLIGLEPKGVGIVKGPDFNGSVSTLFNIAECSNYGNAGIEGLTYYKDGKVFVGAQSNSHLFFCDLATKTKEWDLKLWNKNLISEIGGLCYDPLTDWLWVIDSETKKVFVLSADKLIAADKQLPVADIVASALLGAYPVSEAANPESVCVDHTHSCIWVGDDYGSTSYLYRYTMEGLDDAIINE
ncbi:MAG: hypothetical protein IJR25_04610 [Bacteroidales bacterium]|nr:hypothetical protein [Bacteroidales bacterium]